MSPKHEIAGGFPGLWGFDRGPLPLLAFHRAMKERKYRRLFSPREYEFATDRLADERLMPPVRFLPVTRADLSLCGPLRVVQSRSRLSIAAFAHVVF